MQCSNCSGRLRVIDGLCVHCRLSGVSSSRAARSRTDFNIISKFLTFLPLVCVLIVVAVLVNKYDFVDLFWTKRHKPGVLAPKDPEQISGTFKSWNHRGYLFRPLARYNVEARVLLKNNYWLSPASDLVPLDLTLGWGPMSDQAILDQLSITSGNRCYYWSASILPIPADEINRHAANTHIISKNDEVARILKTVSVGDVINLSGYLVDVSRADGWHWGSSLSREDSGGGACELLWVESVTIR